MTNKKIWLGMLVMVLVFGMTVVGCEDEYDDDEYDDDEYDDRPSIPGFVRLDNHYPVVGEIITASYNASSGTHPRDPIGTPSWRWYKTTEDALSLSSVINKTTIGYSSTYTIRQDDVGYWIWAELSYSGNIGTLDIRTDSTVIGIPATATVSVSINAVYTSFSERYDVTVTLILSDGRWNNAQFYDTESQWLTISGTPTISSWNRPISFVFGRELEYRYTTASDTMLSISNLTATLNTAQLDMMRSYTNVYNTLTAGSPSSASVSEWTMR